jgi:hypothetical protein
MTDMYTLLLNFPRRSFVFLSAFNFILIIYFFNFNENPAYEWTLPRIKKVSYYLRLSILIFTQYVIIVSCISYFMYLRYSLYLRVVIPLHYIILFIFIMAVISMQQAIIGVFIYLIFQNIEIASLFYIFLFFFLNLIREHLIFGNSLPVYQNSLNLTSQQIERQVYTIFASTLIYLSVIIFSNYNYQKLEVL